MASEDRVVTDLVRYPPEALARVIELCEADPESEVCGFIVRREETLEVVAIDNVADRYHAADPAAFPRTSRDSYLMDPMAQLRLLRDVERCGAALVTVWHSHVEVGAYFSAKDRADAVIDGVQQVPGAEYLVLGVRRGRVTEVKRYLHTGTEFIEIALDVALPKLDRERA